jgi:hypothetical protein
MVTELSSYGGRPMNDEVPSPGMDFLDVILIILRRWKIVLPILLLTGVAAGETLARHKATYEATGSLLVEAAGPQIIANPAQPSKGLSVGVAANLLSERLSSSTLKDQVRAQGGPARYTVRVDQLGGLVQIDATDIRADIVIATLKAVLSIAPQELASLQGSLELPEKDRSTLGVLTMPAVTDVRPLPDGTVTATGTAVIFPPGQQAGTYNPYDASGFTTRVLVESMHSVAALQAVHAHGAVPNYTVTRIARDEAPVLSVVAAGATRVQTMNTFKATVAVLQETLDDLQNKAGASKDQRTVLTPLAVPAGASVASASVVRTLVALTALGVVLAGGLAVFFESLSVARRRRRPPGLVRLTRAERRAASRRSPKRKGESRRQRRRRLKFAEAPAPDIRLEQEEPVADPTEPPGDPARPGTTAEQQRKRESRRQRRRSLKSDESPTPDESPAPDAQVEEPEPTVDPLEPMSHQVQLTSTAEQPTGDIEEPPSPVLPAHDMTPITESETGAAEAAPNRSDPSETDVAAEAPVVKRRASKRRKVVTTMVPVDVAPTSVSEPNGSDELGAFIPAVDPVASPSDGVDAPAKKGRTLARGSTGTRRAMKNGAEPSRTDPADGEPAVKRRAASRRKVATPVASEETTPTSPDDLPRSAEAGEEPAASMVDAPPPE